MQQVQDLLQFEIDTPSDAELEKRFDTMMEQADTGVGYYTDDIESTPKYKQPKKRNRKTKHQKKLERLQREVL